MRVLTVTESAEWLSARNLTLHPAQQRGFDHRLELPGSYDRLWFGTPRLASEQLSLCHLLTSWFKCESSLLFVNVVALFQQHELDAFLFLRRCRGDSRRVDGVPGGATPGHLFDEGGAQDKRSVREFMSALLAFTFQGYLVQDDAEVIIWLADEVIDIYARHSEYLTVPESIIDAMKLEVYGRQKG